MNLDRKKQLLIEYGLNFMTLMYLGLYYILTKNSGYALSEFRQPLMILLTTTIITMLVMFIFITKTKNQERNFQKDIMILALIESINLIAIYYGITVFNSVTGN